MTRYGRLGLTVRENTTTGPGTVYTRFDDPKTAHPHTGCNPHRGKWNHHYFDGWTVDTAVIDIERCLRSVLPVAVCAASVPGKPEHLDDLKRRLDAVIQPLPALSPPPADIPSPGSHPANGAVLVS